MSPDREELLRLVEDLPDSEVPAVLAEVRQHIAKPAPPPWPPAWFGSAAGSAPDVAARADDLLAEGFGR